MFKDSLQLLALNVLPQRALSRTVGRLARSPASRVAIPWYANHFKIDLDQAEKPLEQYQTLVEFFTRRLKQGLRPIAPGAGVVVSPVDGRVSASGKITRGRLWQVKGREYSLLDLVGGDREAAERYLDGEFVTIYLSPQDYHRIHVPLGGRIVSATYVPGALFPVNPFAVRNVSNLFARNERLITYLETSAGLVGLVKVGATIVGSVRVVYGDFTTNVAGGRPYSKDIDFPRRLAKGDEIGRFEFGSTVILLFEKGRVKLDRFQTDQVVKLGEAIGEVVAVRKR